LKNVVPKDVSTFRHVPEETDGHHSRLFIRDSSQEKSEYRTENLASELRYSFSCTIRTLQDIDIGKNHSFNLFLGKELVKILT